MYGLAEAEYWDKDTWNLLAEHISQHNYDYQVVKNDRWGVG